MRKTAVVNNTQDKILNIIDKYIHFIPIHLLNLVSNCENSKFIIFWKFGKKNIQKLLGFSKPYFGYIFDKMLASPESFKTLFETFPISTNLQHPTLVFVHDCHNR